MSLLKRGGWVLKDCFIVMAVSCLVSLAGCGADLSDLLDNPTDATLTDLVESHGERRGAELPDCRRFVGQFYSEQRCVGDGDDFQHRGGDVFVYRRRLCRCHAGDDEEQ